MLNTEKQEIIQGCIIYQDYTDANNFYCLPEEKAKIADNGKGLQYVVYTDDEILEGDSPNFDNDESRVGGFLTLQVELGPTEEKLESIREELQSKYGDTINLSMVPFKEGSVKLVMFGKDGNNDENDDFQISIAGSTKPSLRGRQTAVFSTRLSNKPAQIMWNLLKEEGQTQVAVVYDLGYLGVMKAYNLEITVDFKATEDFWNHTFNLDANINSSSKSENSNSDVKIAASADVDVMIRELMSNGAITVKQVVYAEGESQTNILGNDPTGIALVKKLMGTEIFNATAIPSEDYNAAINERIANSTRNEEEDADGPPGGDDQDNPPTTGNGDTDEGDGDEIDDDDTIDGTNTPNDRPNEDTNEDTNENDENEGDENEGGNNEDENNDDDGESAEDQENPDNNDTDDDAPNDDVNPPESSEENEDNTNNDNDDDAEESKTKSALAVDIKVGYTLRRREISQQIKRKFTFEKAEAKTLKYYPNGALTVANTAFDADKQLQLVRLGDGPFKKIELEVRASFDFEEYQIREAIVHISYGYKGVEGDKTKRLHEHSFTLDKLKLNDKIKFFVDQYGTLTYDYQVEFIHDTGSIIGSPETKVVSQLFEDEVRRDLSINMDTHSPLIPVEIQSGELQFHEDGIQSVHVFIAPEKGGNGRTTILNKDNSELKRYLIHPPEENKYDYFLRKEFFFKEEKLIFEEENIKDSQIIIDRPFARIFSITPNLTNSHKIIKQALIDIKYTAADNDVKETTLSLTPEIPTKSFAVLVEENDPRTWTGRSRFVLNDGRLLEGDFINYDTEQPFINLDNSGFRTVKISTLLGVATFSGKIVALQISLNSTNPDIPGSAELFLNQTKLEDIAILPDMPITVALNATVKIFNNDGSSQEDLSFVIPANSSALMLPITTIN